MLVPDTSFGEGGEEYTDQEGTDQVHGEGAVGKDVAGTFGELATDEVSSDRPDPATDADPDYIHNGLSILYPNDRSLSEVYE